jgi:RTX calcium-binding nonapeptide repeat (4 copies)
MQGVWVVGVPRHRPRFAGAIAIFCAGLLCTAGEAGAFVTSEVKRGRLIARSDGGSDIVKVSCGADLRVKVNGLDPTNGPAPCAAIRRVRVLGSGGADTINVSRVGPRNGFSHPRLRRGYAVEAYGGASADRISGSRLADLMAGGDGHDTLRGRAGTDLLRGRAGADLLRGARGPDLLRGGRGSDKLVGGPGPDSLRGGRGDDVLLGRRGDDFERD